MNVNRSDRINIFRIRELIPWPSILLIVGEPCVRIRKEQVVVDQHQKRRLSVSELSVRGGSPASGVLVTYDALV